MIVYHKNNSSVNIANCSFFQKESFAKSVLYWNGPREYKIAFYFGTYKVYWKFSSKEERDQCFDNINIEKAKLV